MSCVLPIDVSRTLGTSPSTYPFLYKPQRYPRTKHAISSPPWIVLSFLIPSSLLLESFDYYTASPLLLHFPQPSDDVLVDGISTLFRTTDPPCPPPGGNTHGSSSHRLLAWRVRRRHRETRLRPSDARLMVRISSRSRLPGRGERLPLSCLLIYGTVNC